MATVHKLLPARPDRSLDLAIGTAMQDSLKRRGEKPVALAPLPEAEVIEFRRRPPPRICCGGPAVFGGGA